MHKKIHTITVYIYSSLSLFNYWNAYGVMFIARRSALGSNI
jgi:hypothetical protein